MGLADDIYNEYITNNNQPSQPATFNRSLADDIYEETYGRSKGNEPGITERPGEFTNPIGQYFDNIRSGKEPVDWREPIDFLYNVDKTVQSGLGWASARIPSSGQAKAQELERTKGTLSAWEENQANPIAKFIIETAANPLTYVGTGLLGKVPVVGKVLGPVDKALDYIPSQIGKGIGKGVQELPKVGKYFKPSKMSDVAKAENMAKNAMAELSTALPDTSPTDLLKILRNTDNEIDSLPLATRTKETLKLQGPFIANYLDEIIGDERFVGENIIQPNIDKFSSFDDVRSAAETYKGTLKTDAEKARIDKILDDRSALGAILRHYANTGEWKKPVAPISQAVDDIIPSTPVQNVDEIVPPQSTIEEVVDPFTTQTAKDLENALWEAQSRGASKDEIEAIRKYYMELGETVDDVPAPNELDEFFGPSEPLPPTEDILSKPKNAAEELARSIQEGKARQKAASNTGQSIYTKGVVQQIEGISPEFAGVASGIQKYHGNALRNRSKPNHLYDYTAAKMIAELAEFTGTTNYTATGKASNLPLVPSNKKIDLTRLNDPAYVAERFGGFRIPEGGVSILDNPAFFATGKNVKHKEDLLKQIDEINRLRSSRNTPPPTPGSNIIPEGSGGANPPTVPPEAPPTGPLGPDYNPILSSKDIMLLAANAYVDALAKGVNVVPQMPWDKLTSVPANMFKETVLMTPRYHIANATDQAFKSALHGFFPWTTKGNATDFMQSIGKPGIPHDIAKGFNMYELGDTNKSQSAFRAVNPALRMGTGAAIGGIGGAQASEGDPTAIVAGMMIGAGLGKLAPTLSEFNRRTATALEGSTRSAALKSGTTNYLKDYVATRYADEVAAPLIAAGHNPAPLQQLLLKTNGIIHPDIVEQTVTELGASPELVQKTKQVWLDVVDDAQKAGIDQVSHIHFNYSDVLLIDEYLRKVVPFHFWATRNIPFYAKHAVEKPVIPSTLIKYNEMSTDEQESKNLPQRFDNMVSMGTGPTFRNQGEGDKFASNLFGMPSSIFLNPAMLMSITGQIKEPYMSDEMNPLEKAMSMGQTVGINPFPPVQWAATAIGKALGMGGSNEVRDLLPQTQLLREGSRQLGKPIEPEPWKKTLNTALQGPTATGSPTEDYYVRKTIAEMSIQDTGQANNPSYLLAMHNPQSPIWKEARDRVSRMNLGSAAFRLNAPMTAKPLPDIEALSRLQKTKLNEEIDIRKQVEAAKTALNNIDLLPDKVQARIVAQTYEKYPLAGIYSRIYDTPEEIQEYLKKKKLIP